MWAPHTDGGPRRIGAVAPDPEENTVTIDDLARALRDPSIEYRPELRWWLAEGIHTDETLRREIDAAHAFGFGGMEFLAMDEGDINHARYGWGAEEWVHDSQVVVE